MECHWAYFCMCAILDREVDWSGPLIGIRSILEGMCTSYERVKRRGKKAKFRGFVQEGIPNVPVKKFVLGRFGLDFPNQISRRSSFSCVLSLSSIPR